VIGEELVTNGTFDTDSNWTKGTGWTISGGVAENDGTASDAIISNGTILEVGKVYEVSIDIVSRLQGVVRIEKSGTDITVGTSPGSYTIVFTADQTNFGVVGAANFIGSIDNISVKEINPLAVSIAMEGTMTYADTGESVSSTPKTGTVNFYSMSSDVNNYITGILDTEATNLGVVRFLQEVNSVADLSSSSEVYSPSVNVPFNIASRHGSTFINGAVDGTALTENTTPVALPDLSTTDLQLGYDFMGTIKTFRVWADDISDVGIEEASS
jgi:hypothetical protein